jgi:hypothetical protein
MSMTTTNDDFLIKIRVQQAMKFYDGENSVIHELFLCLLLHFISFHILFLRLANHNDLIL